MKGKTSVNVGASVRARLLKVSKERREDFTLMLMNYAARSEVATDLLTSPGRGPNEAEASMQWMQENEDAWPAGKDKTIGPSSPAVS